MVPLKAEMMVILWADTCPVISHDFHVIIISFRLEAYDKNNNFGQEILDEKDVYDMSIPDASKYKDINTDTEVSICFIAKNVGSRGLVLQVV